MSIGVGPRRSRRSAEAESRARARRCCTAISESRVPFVVAGGHRLEYAWYGPDESERPPIVMLHEGLGSVSMWRDFPQRLADATGRRTLAYSRYGYGQSDPLTEPRRVDYMHAEALAALPQLLDALAIREPVLFGHSDGASIALIHAACAQRTAALIALAPHVFVEPSGVASIAATRSTYLDGDLREKLARHHADVESAFWGWNDIWLHPDFTAWNIEALLPAIACPMLAIQGLDDEYGTMAQLDRIARGVPELRRLELEDCGHSPHRDQPEAVLAAAAHFLAR
jgi:pimeloyl-ACP methyl ester carboxylesterase